MAVQEYCCVVPLIAKLDNFVAVVLLSSPADVSMCSVAPAALSCPPSSVCAAANAPTVTQQPPLPPPLPKRPFLSRYMSRCTPLRPSCVSRWSTGTALGALAGSAACSGAAAAGAASLGVGCSALVALAVVRLAAAIAARTLQVQQRSLGPAVSAGLLLQL